MKPKQHQKNEHDQHDETVAGDALLVPQRAKPLDAPAAR